MRTLWRRIAAVSVAALLTATIATPARAVTATTSLLPVGSTCTLHGSLSQEIPWYGGFPPQTAAPLGPAPRGHVYVCLYLYKLADGEPAADYYVADTVSYWSFENGEDSYPAAINQSVTSNYAAISNVYDATPSFTSGTSCTSGISLSAAIGPFSVSTTPRVCSGYRVTRSSLTTKGAYWSSPMAAGLRTVELQYSQKVTAGNRPTFSASFGIPQYSTSYNGLYWVTTAHIVYQPLTLRATA